MSCIDGSGSTRARCVLAPNPSPLTLEGTNTWLLAEPGGSHAAVVDPGPEDTGHLRRVVAHAAARDLRVGQILLTHGHPDHSEGARRLAEMTGAPVRALLPGYREGGGRLGEGEVVELDGLELRVLATPGHSGDSLCFFLPGDGALLTGDTVLGRGTAVIAHDGRLRDYLYSLDRLRAFVDSLGVRTLLPGHGPVLDDPASALDHYIAHRKQRLDQVRSALRAGDRSPSEIVRRVYSDQDPSLWPAAELSVRAQLDYLRERGLTPPDV